MRRIALTRQAQETLEAPFKQTSDRRLRDRCQAVLMASRGRKRSAIAQDLGVHRSPVVSWLKQYQAHGCAGLQMQWAPGRPRRMPADLAPTLQGWIKGGPQRCGLDRANWPDEE
jgi:transposase